MNWEFTATSGNKAFARLTRLNVVQSYFNGVHSYVEVTWDSPVSDADATEFDQYITENTGVPVLESTRGSV